MHKKITVRGGDGKLRYFVLDDAGDIPAQMHTLYQISMDYGIGVELNETSIRVWDYYHAELKGSLPIVSREETELPVALYWTDVESPSDK